MKISELFGSMVFNDSVMQQRLPRETYKAIRKAIEENSPLDLYTANVVANAMKDWAIEKGVTHYTHWFQPMTNITAEKHESFISARHDGNVIMEFSGKELIKGEPDASSLPSGGLRATFEARGYTAWDPTSYTFIKDGVLCIPTAFCAYGGEALDKKTPLLRSMKALNTQALRVLRLFGNNDVSRVLNTVGPEQEYFLIDKAAAGKRRDLMICGRTLFGAKSPKGQEMDDHYFGTIRPRVAEFMKELDTELWKLGILAKTKHNETAPSQHELASIFTTANMSADQNQLTMELMKKVAERHGMTCLLHEKPFEGVNGSGKHNNWSISTNTGVNLLEPGESPQENAQFLLFLVAIIKATDEHQDLLRLASASAGNDLRLGSHEAPPAIISIFLGDELTDILTSIEQGTAYNGHGAGDIEIGVDVLPRIPKDSTDRNRTSPFAFTGNKFEFRMLGSAFSLSGPNFLLNTIVADVLSGFADRLENCADFRKELPLLIRETFSVHKRIIFNGNNYTQDWVGEAEKRGLLNLPSTPDVFQRFILPENCRLFERHGVFTTAEVHSRCDILMSGFCKTIHIEALTMLDIVRRDIIPCVIRAERELSETIVLKKQAGGEMSGNMAEQYLLGKLSGHLQVLHKHVCDLDEAVSKVKDMPAGYDQAQFYNNQVRGLMDAVRAEADALETLMPSDLWPMPTYAQLLFSV